MGEKDITEVPGIGAPRKKSDGPPCDRTGKAATALRNGGYRKVSVTFKFKLFLLASF